MTTEEFTVRIWRVQHGYAWVAFTGDGSEPGSVVRGESAYENPGDAYRAAADCLRSQADPGPKEEA